MKADVIDEAEGSSPEHAKAIELLRLRVNDGGIIRLIGKWFNAGVLDGGALSYPEKGTFSGYHYVKKPGVLIKSVGSSRCSPGL